VSAGPAGPAESPDGGVTPSRELAWWWQLVAERYGDRLDDAQREDLRRVVEGVVAGVRELRAVPLSNADAPVDLAVTWRLGRRPAS
jgi:hypothetical protein